MNECFREIRLHSVISFLSILFFMASCSGGSNGGGSGDVGSETNHKPTTALTVTGKSGNQVHLNGTWNKQCDPDMEEGESESATATITGSNFSQEMNFWFNSTTCTGIPDATATLTASFGLGAQLTTTLNGSNVTATEIDITWESYDITPNTQEMVSQFNANNGCGFNDWVLNSPKDLLGSKCGPDPIQYDLLYIDDTVTPNVMLSGDDDQGAPIDENGYPTSIDADTTMERM
jgi:hypothetical protein